MSIFSKAGELISRLWRKEAPVVAHVAEESVIGRIGPASVEKAAAKGAADLPKVPGWWKSHFVEPLHPFRTRNPGRMTPHIDANGNVIANPAFEISPGKVVKNVKRGVVAGGVVGLAGAVAGVADKAGEVTGYDGIRTEFGHVARVTAGALSGHSHNTESAQNPASSTNTLSDGKKPSQGGALAALFNFIGDGNQNGKFDFEDVVKFAQTKHGIITTIAVMAATLFGANRLPDAIASPLSQLIVYAGLGLGALALGDNLLSGQNGGNHAPGVIPNQQLALSPSPALEHK